MVNTWSQCRPWVSWVKCSFVVELSQFWLLLIAAQLLIGILPLSTWTWAKGDACTLFSPVRPHIPLKKTFIFIFKRLLCFFRCPRSERGAPVCDSARWRERDPGVWRVPSPGRPAASLCGGMVQVWSAYSHLHQLPLLPSSCGSRVHW